MSSFYSASAKLTSATERLDLLNVSMEINTTQNTLYWSVAKIQLIDRLHTQHLE